MKAVLLAGGFGTRISEETGVRPKPMVEIGGKPILWHIMKIYSHYGINDFIICSGYKGNIIKEYFMNYFLLNSDITFDLLNNDMKVHHTCAEPWNVTVADTGGNTMTGGRIKRIREYVGNETFCLTYGDGVSNVNIKSLIAYHRKHGLLATLTSVKPEGRFGVFNLPKDESKIRIFKEKPKGDDDDTAWVNGGFFVLEPGVMDYIEGDDTVFEQKPLENLANAGQLAAFRHNGFWQPMDTIRDRNVLEKLWESPAPPWKVW
jgi:glucose-1-phosphate cytidylyltransferase